MRAPLALFLFVSSAAGLGAQSIDRGIELFEAHDRAAARSEFAAVLKNNREDARAHYYLGRLALIDNDVDVAADYLEHAVKLDPRVADYHFWYGSAVAQQASRASKVRMPFMARRTMGAVERAVALDGRHVGARDLLVDFYSMAPAMMGGGADKAQAQARALAAIDPVSGHLAQARLAIIAKNGAAVERETSAAIALAPDSLRAYTTLASWYIREKNWPRAFATIDRYAKRQPNDLHAAYHVGRIAALSGEQLSRGEQALRAFLGNPPNDAPPPLISRAYLRLGQVLEQQGKPAEGRTAITHAIKLDPRNEDAKKALK